MAKNFYVSSVFVVDGDDAPVKAIFSAVNQAISGSSVSGFFLLCLTLITSFIPLAQIMTMRFSTWVIMCNDRHIIHKMRAGL
jgi:hypothetical protein